ncbi:monovalent cation/H+ antiporter subunit D [Novilysobacter defluvii]|uniref:Cation:proton antiporter n=1 Tax=Lysobacter defluvii IMMIB APB-9 = DSM 18482 TaxID=1385515 RepID=A0A0A0M8D2_9GAMM|nr:monovalent cation/H+ antiporter subunit D [Lysobacter defluvii]KGO99340.1 cation:proton antiporter [Lysobacter defluvii IMMIB APB-9 = DSM 18482]
MSHLPLLPILIPVIGGALSLFVEHRRIGTVVQRSVAWVFMLACLAATVGLVVQASSGEVLVYLLGDWPSRLGIVLMVDRLSALMLLTTNLLAAACLLHACSGWDRRALHFHALFQLQLVGLNGAFLTGDVFNLFVFFEVMLIASYGLLLSGGRGVRMTAGLHYVVFNVAASTLFLIGLGLLYGVLGTLNMAEIAVKVANLPAHDLALAKAVFGLLLVVFCAKAALTPLYLWLPETYTRAPAAVAALFVVMSKVGIYAVLRIWALMLGEAAGPLQDYGWSWILPLAVVTLALGALGVLAAARMRMLVAYLVLVSAATLFIAFGLRQPGTIGAGLYYLVHSTFVAAALFMIAELVRRGRGDASTDLREINAPPPVRRMASIMFLVAAVSIAGLPPLSGFIGKLALLAAVPAEHVGWAWSAILASSLMVIIGLARAGGRVFWRNTRDANDIRDRAGHSPGPKGLRSMRATETAATMLLLAYGIAMTLAAAPVIEYTEAAARQLLAPGDYVAQLRGTAPEMRNP